MWTKLDKYRICKILASGPLMRLALNSVLENSATVNRRALEKIFPRGLVPTTIGLVTPAFISR
jgi:hypothetical protein